MKCFTKYIRNVSEQSEIFPNKCKIFLIIQNIMKCLTSFIGNSSCKHFFQHTLRCSQTNLNVSEHSKMLPTNMNYFLSFQHSFRVFEMF